MVTSTIPEIPGTITNVSLKNFMTYDHLDYYPGPGLNVILGVNGSGKSSLICAICIGLGGDPKVLGRSPNIREYIKKGREKALVKTSLKRKDAAGNVQISRFIKGSSSEWAIDGEKCTKQKVSELVKSLHIQVDNLCQFLAQERVSDFAQQSPKELLENMELVISTNEKNFYEQHQNLKQMFCDGQDRQSGVDRIQQQLDQKRTAKTQMEPDVAQEKERLEIRKHINIIKAKTSFMKYENKRNKFMDKKAEIDQLRRQKSELETRLAPLMERVTVCKQRLQRSTKEYADLKIKCIDDTQSAKTRFGEAVSNEKDSLQQVALQLDGARSEVEQRQEDLDRVNHQIASIQHDIDELPDQADQKAEYEELSSNLRAAEDAVADLSAETSRIDSQIKQKQLIMRRLDARLRSFQSAEMKKMNVLRQNHSKQTKLACRVYEWIQSNKSHFRGEVYGPLCLHINPKDRDAASFVECAVDNRDLAGVLCTDKDDVSNVTRGLKNAKIFCGVFHVDRGRTFSLPKMSQQMKQLGFDNFLLEMFTAPDPVRTFLCQTARLNTIPVGNAHSAQNLDQCSQACSAAGYNLMMMPGLRVGMKRSRYSGQTSTATSSIRNASLIMANSDESGDIENLRQQNEILRRECESLTESIRQLTGRHSEALKDADSYKKRKNDLNESIKKHGLLNSQLRSKARRKRDLEEMDVDVDGLERKLLEKKHNFLLAIGKALHRFNEMTKKLWMNEETLAKICCKVMEHQRGIDKYEVDFKEAKDILEDQKKALEHEEDSLKTFRASIIDLKKAAEALCHLKDGKPPPELLQKFKEIPFDEDELDELRRVQSAKLRCLGDGNEEVMRQYNSCLEVIGELEQRLAHEHDRINNYENELRNHKEAWLEPLLHEIARINRNFSSFFEQMGCAGEVKLVPGADENDFKNYGLKLRVKFRPEEDLQDLDAQRQSGGERSVSTILFMLALQELSRVPFRCVDEINQGMDATNERRVFNLMTKLLSRDVGARQGSGDRSRLASSQYFMLTPKLLDGLEFTRWTNVFVVCNTGDTDRMIPELSAQRSIEAKRRAKNRRMSMPTLSINDVIKHEVNDENLF